MSIFEINDEISTNYGIEFMVEQNGHFISEHFLSEFSAKMTHSFLQQLNHVNDSNSIIRMDHFTSYLVISSLAEGTNYILGPILSKTLTNPSQTNYIDKFHIRFKDIPAFNTYLTSLKRYNYSECFSLFQDLYKLINKNSIREEDIHFINMNKLHTKRADSTFQNLSDQLTFSSSTSSAMESYYHEIRVCHFVKDGNPEGLISFLEEEKTPLYNGLCDNVITDVRNTGISAITLTSHAAIEGGLDIEISLRLMDLYIYLLSDEKDVDQILAIISSAMIKFATAVRENRLPTDISPITKSAIRYIKSNIMAPLSVKKIGKELHINSTYLSKVFSKDMGLSLSMYIKDVKIEKARELLKYTNIPLSRISEELCFSSQQHFQKVFKQTTGLTPNQYRTSFSVADRINPTTF